jgi:uncharacterized membrane protein
MNKLEPKNKISDFFDTNLKSYVEFEREWSSLVARFLTKFFGSAWFLNANIIFILVWIVWNLGWIPGLRPFDPYPFLLMPMIASLSAMLLAIVVLINQNEQGKMADIRQRIDFEVNVRAETEITKILKMLDAFNGRLGIIKADEELEKMKEKIDIAEIKGDIERGIEKEDGKVTNTTPPFDL